MQGLGSAGFSKQEQTQTGQTLQLAQLQTNCKRQIPYPRWYCSAHFAKEMATRFGALDKRLYKTLRNTVCVWRNQ